MTTGLRVGPPSVNSDLVPRIRAALFPRIHFPPVIGAVVVSVAIAHHSYFLIAMDRQVSLIEGKRRGIGGSTLANREPQDPIMERVSRRDNDAEQKPAFAN